MTVAKESVRCHLKIDVQRMTQITDLLWNGKRYIKKQRRRKHNAACMAESQISVMEEHIYDSRQHRNISNGKEQDLSL